MKVNTIAKNKGMTLIEITLVIAILLGLIAILFVGVAAYKRGSDRAKCVLNISTIQKVAYSHANMQNYNPGDALNDGDMFGSDPTDYMETPECPSEAGAFYSFGSTVPLAEINAYGTCTSGAVGAGSLHDDAYAQTVTGDATATASPAP